MKDPTFKTSQLLTGAPRTGWTSFKCHLIVFQKRAALLEMQSGSLHYIVFTLVKFIVGKKWYQKYQHGLNRYRGREDLKSESTHSLKAKAMVDYIGCPLPCVLQETQHYTCKIHHDLEIKKVSSQ